MKKTILFTILASMVLTSCDGLLNRFPEDTVTPESYFMTATDFELWSNAFYTMLPDTDITEMNCDDIIDNDPQGCIKGSRSAATETWSWTQLRNINYMIENSVHCTDPGVRARWDAVGYFFRAYFYFVKVRNYGDVPWYDRVIGSGDEALLQKARDDRAYVMYKVMEDFDKAAEYLPAAKNVSQVNKWTALAMKARAALYEGTFRKYHGLPDVEVEGRTIGADFFLEEAAAAAKAVIDGGQYKLATGATIYRDMFVAEDANTDEYILARVYGDILGNDIRHDLANSRAGFTRRFMNHYLLKNGKSITTVPGYETMSFAEETKDRDPRLAQTVQCAGSKVKGSAIPYLKGVTGYQPVKYESVTAKNSSGKGTLDLPIIRYPEVLLTYAEAKAELGTITQSDIDRTVNVIRGRVGMPGLIMEAANAAPDALLASYYPNTDSGDANFGVILEIRRERTVELVMEGHRQWDMMRWKEGSLMVNHDNPYYGAYIASTGVID
ncbi:MAG: RagB/SusD family nutrient uptake outer membrane protein, partial [Bacteroidales bacterium]|nr:RagB/SusD family nutrient uptake outer membrane protein [Bacteroidales bacterium]